MKIIIIEYKVILLYYNLLHKNYFLLLNYIILKLLSLAKHIIASSIVIQFERIKNNSSNFLCLLVFVKEKKRDN